jgi:hypothetical protein
MRSGSSTHLFPLLLILLSQSEASIISIVDSLDAFPFLRSVDDPVNNMRWDSGRVVQMMSSCKLVRITRRGVRCISANDQLIVGWQDRFLRSTDGRHTQHKAALCLPLINVLCVTSNGRRFFPTDTVFVKERSVLRCINGQGRRIVPDVHTQTANDTMDYSRDDVSLCDVLDTNLDVIYDPVNNHIFTRQLSDATWLYVIMSILILIVVVLTAEAVSQSSRSKLTHNMVAWLLLAGVSLLMLTHADGRMHMFVSTQDRAFVTMSFLYIVASTMYWFSTVFGCKHEVKLSPTNACDPLRPILPGNISISVVNNPHDQIPSTTEKTSSLSEKVSPSTVPPLKVSSITPVSSTYSDTQRDGINAMLGSIHFATCVLYGTPDNVYVSAFFFLFLFRCMQKIYDAHQTPDKWTMYANTVLLLDITYTTIIFSFGVLPHFTNDAETTLYAAAQYIICDTIAYNSVISSVAVVTVAIAANPVKPPDTGKS